MYIPRERLLFSGLLVGSIQMISLTYISRGSYQPTDIRADMYGSMTWFWVFAGCVLALVAQGDNMQFRRAVVAAFVMNLPLNLLVDIYVLASNQLLPISGYCMFIVPITFCAGLAGFLNSGRAPVATFTAGVLAVPYEVQRELLTSNFTGAFGLLRDLADILSPLKE